MAGPGRGALGVDHGTRRTGFASVDAARILVTPLDAVEGGDPEVLDAVEALAEERDVGVLVVGYPLHMDGAAGPRAAEVDAFIARALERFPGLEVVRQDERLTTREAEERLRDAGYHGAERKARKDSWSAMVLLEDWIRAGEPR
ncbi:MAG: Holliday junction resolvase RuvX [Planctomycetota bacterium]|jgi:putative Holliday junction resolvase